jgi:ferric-dicitrate binding protein FerR (iron transport regulator)
MRTRIPCLLLAVPWFCLSAAAAEPPSDAARIAALIEQLGSPQFAEREAATQLLDQSGLPALAALRRATHDKDGEIVRRAKELVERLERRQKTAQALEALRLRLVYKDAPLSEVVADFARKTGLPVQLDPKEQARLGQRRLTLVDGRGQTILPQQARQLAGNGEAVQYELTYLLAKEQGADKLIYTGRRRVLIEVPFTLKDVPLP